MRWRAKELGVGGGVEWVDLQMTPPIFNQNNSSHECLVLMYFLELFLLLKSHLHHHHKQQQNINLVQPLTWHMKTEPNKS